MKTFIFTRKRIELEWLVVDAQTEKEARKIIENNGDYECFDSEDLEVLPNTLTLDSIQEEK